jgi:hypothetical protein
MRSRKPERKRQAGRTPSTEQDIVSDSNDGFSTRERFILALLALEWMVLAGLSRRAQLGDRLHIPAICFYATLHGLTAGEQHRLIQAAEEMLAEHPLPAAFAGVGVIDFLKLLCKSSSDPLPPEPKSPAGNGTAPKTAGPA